MYVYVCMCVCVCVCECKVCWGREESERGEKGGGGVKML